MLRRNLHVHLLLYLFFCGLMPSELVIDRPGTFQLGSDILFAPAAPGDAAIQITTDDVILDCAGRVIRQTNGTALTNAISVAADVSNITIKNGYIEAFTGQGIFIDEGVSDLRIQDVEITDTPFGIVAAGLVSNEIERMQLANVDVINSSTAISCSNVRCSRLEDISVASATTVGISLLTSYTNVVRNSSIRCMDSSEDLIAGIYMNSGGGNNVERCTINNLTSSSASRSATIGGIIIGLSELNDIVDGNVITDIISTGFASARGIDLRYQVSNLATVNSFTGSTFSLDWKWSPNDQFGVLSGFTGNQLNLFRQEESNFPLLQIVTGGNCRSISWSPDGRYLLAGFEAGGISSRIYEFDGTQLTLIVAFNTGTIIEGLDWSPKGGFVAVPTGTATFNVFPFTGAAVGTAITAAVPTDTAERVVWHPSGQFLVVTTSSNVFYLYGFNGTTLTLLTTVTLPAGIVFIQGADWSPDGRFLAIGDGNGTTLGELRIFEFNQVSTLTPVLGTPYVYAPSSRVQDVSWTGDGRLLAITGDGNGSLGPVQILSFNGNSVSLLATSVPPGGISGSDATEWSHNGKYVAEVHRLNTDLTFIRTGLNFSAGHEIRNNIVAQVTHPGNNATKIGGVGISASTGDNAVLNNLVYGCDVNFAFVSSPLPFREGLVNVLPSSTFANTNSDVSLS